MRTALATRPCTPHNCPAPRARTHARTHTHPHTPRPSLRTVLDKMRTAILAFAFPLVAFAYEGDDKLGTCSGEDTVVKSVCAVTEGVCHAWSSEPTAGATWPTSPTAGKVWPLDRGTWVSNLISVHGKTATTATKMYFTSPPLAGILDCRHGAACKHSSQARRGAGVRCGVGLRTELAALGCLAHAVFGGSK